MWALLRSLRLLAGTRDAALPPPRALVAGPGAAHLAARMAALEPTLRCVVNDASAALTEQLARLKGQRFDGAVISQPLLALSARGVGHELAALRACVDEARGAAGFVGARAAPAAVPQPWVEAFAAAARAEHGGRGRAAGEAEVAGAWPLPSGSAMEFFDAAFDVAGAGFPPVRHRKFAERLEGTPSQLLPALELTHDLARPARAVEAGRRAALELNRGDGILELDVHMWTTKPLPFPVGTKGKV